MSFRTHTRTPSLTSSASEYSSSDPSIPPSPIHSLPSPLSRKGHEHRRSPTNASSTLLSVSPFKLEHHLSFRSLLKQPRVLANILQCCSVNDFRHLMSTCREFRSIFRHEGLKNTILAHFIPGYRSSLRSRDPLRFVDVPCTISDLLLFLVSARVGLHVYPLSSLSLISSPSHSGDEIRHASKLRELTRAYSRLVLVVQALAHSSSSSTYELESLEWKASVPRSFKELQFPAPLSYQNLSLKDGLAIPFSEGIRVIKRPRTADAAVGPNRQRTRSTIFGCKAPPPPPSSDPITLQQYSDSWRRALRSSPSIDGLTSRLVRPRRLSESRSSRLSSVSSPSRSTGERNRGPAPVHGTFPHDFNLASSRTHAPILRVFVPCTRVDERSIARCQDELIDAGLWDHLSTGDVVCNLGYLPPADAQFQPHGTAIRGNEWLIFDGFRLVPWSPTDPLPISDAFTLPSPFYYSHLLPSSSNPVYPLVLGPHLPSNGQKLQFALTPVPNKIKSPHSPGGFAVVKKYKWLASIKGRKTEVGGAWQTGWMFEGEGTPEGRLILEDLLTGSRIEASWLWEIDHEKSSQTRIWLRLIGPSSTTETDKMIDRADLRTISFA